MNERLKMDKNKKKISRIQQLQIDLRLKDDMFVSNRDSAENIIKFVSNTDLSDHDYKLFKELIFDLIDEKNSLNEELSDLQDATSEMDI